MTRGQSTLNRRHVVAGLASAPLLLGSSTAWPQAIRKGGTLVVGIQDNPPHLLTGISVDILTICVAGQIYDTLIKMDTKFNVGPSLAKSWSASSDGLKYTFELERGVIWHDGRRFTSADVAYTFTEISGKYSSLARAAFKEIGSI